MWIDWLPHPDRELDGIRISLSPALQSVLERIAHGLMRPAMSEGRILAAIASSKDSIMTRLTDAATKLSGDDAELLLNIETLLAQNESGAQARIAAAVKAALDAHAIDDDAQAAILEAADTAVAAENTRIKGLLNPETGGGAPPEALTITTTALADAEIGAPFNDQIAVTGGVAPITISVSGIDPGLSVDSNGVVTGSAVGPAGSSSLSVTATDSATPSPTTASATVTQNVAAAPGG